MAGNRSAFEMAMKQAAEFAWNQQWEEALAEYQRAAEEFPDDMAARGNLALAFYRVGRWESALVHYTWMLERAPDNAFIMDRLIEVFLKLERRTDAKKVQARLDALNARQRGGTSALTPHPPSPNQQAVRPAREGGSGSLAVMQENEIIALAMAFEESGKAAEAMKHYEQALRIGVDRADVHYSLGMLYQQGNRHQDAIKLFARCLDDVNYAMSATFATGVSLRALGDRKDAARMLSLAISLIDHDQIGPNELPELVTIYRTAIDALLDIENVIQASNLAAGLADFLETQQGYAAVRAEFQELTQRLQADISTMRAPTTPDPHVMAARAAAAAEARAMQAKAQSGQAAPAPAAPRQGPAPATQQAAPRRPAPAQAAPAALPAPAAAPQQPPAMAPAVKNPDFDLSDIFARPATSGHGGAARSAAAMPDIFAEPTAPSRGGAARPADPAPGIIAAPPTAGASSPAVASPVPDIFGLGPAIASPTGEGPSIADIFGDSPPLSAAGEAHIAVTSPTHHRAAGPQSTGPKPTFERHAPASETPSGRRMASLVQPMFDEEASERLSSRYRQLAGALPAQGEAGDDLAMGPGTGDLGGKGGTGTLGPRHSGTGPMRGTKALGTRGLGTRRLGTKAPGEGQIGRTTTMLGARSTTLFGDRAGLSSGTVRLLRLRRLTFPLPGLASEPAAVQTLMADAETNARAGHTFGAIDDCRVAVANAPFAMPIYFRVAELYGQRGDMDGASETAQLALRVLSLREAPALQRLPFLWLLARIRPSDELVLSALSETAHQAGVASQYSALIRRFVRHLFARSATSRCIIESERLLYTKMDHRLNLLHHAEMLVAVGQPQKALDLFRARLRVAPQDTRALFGANLAFAALGHETDWWSSLSALMATVRQLGRQGHVSLRLARLLVGTGADTQARVLGALALLAMGMAYEIEPWIETLLEEGVVSDPRLKTVILEAGACAAAAIGDRKLERERRAAVLGLLAQPGVEQAIGHLQLFDHPLTVSHLGAAFADAQLNTGSPAEAIATLEALRKSSPGNEPVLTRLADYYLEAGKLGAALSALDELAGHHRDAGRLEEMARVLDRMSQMAPNNVTVKTKLIEAYLERGFVDQARRELELKAQLLIDGGKVREGTAAMQHAADILWGTGRKAEAYALCERLVTIDPANTDARQSVVAIFLQDGQTDRAIEHLWQLANVSQQNSNRREEIATLHQLIGLAPADTRVYHRLGEALVAIGEYVQAERVYERLVRQAPEDAVARARRASLKSLVERSSSTDAA